jgi:23S rRNA pseudouridine1911/1915/1917 synthase
MTPEDSIRFSVEPPEAGLRLDAVVAARLDQCSRSYAARLIRRGHAWVDGSIRKPGYKVKLNEQIECRLPPPEPIDLVAEALPLDVLFEDRHLIVLNKPPGMVVHPAAGHSGGTLVNALLYYCPDLEGIGGRKRPGIVHRLDKDTSGVLVVAKTDKAHHELSRQFKARKIGKRYLALVHGSPQNDCGRIDLPIGRHPKERKKMSTLSTSGREALTEWRVRERYDGAALLEIDLQTGRTHQIRVHCSAMGHPIVGDGVYGGRRTLSRLARENASLHAIVKSAKRQMLHARQLKFHHPATAQLLSFKAPLHEDMHAIIERLKQLRAREKITSHF